MNEIRALRLALALLFWVLVVLAAVLQTLALTQRHNIFDTMPIRCGRGLREVCPPTGINWGRP